MFLLNLLDSLIHEIAKRSENSDYAEQHDEQGEVKHPVHSDGSYSYLSELLATGREKSSESDDRRQQTSGR